MNHQLKASLFVTLSAILYGFLAFLGTRIIEQHISISTMLFWRFLIAGLWMLPFVLHKINNGKIQFNIGKKAFLFTFIFSAIGYVGSAGFYFVACQYTGTGLAMVIFFCYPILIALFAWLFERKKLTLVMLITFIAMLIGLFLLRDADAYKLSILGISFALLAAASYSFYLLGTKQQATKIKIDSTLLTLIVCFSCTVVFFLFALVTGSFTIPNTIKAWLYIFALSIFATALPIQLMLEGLNHISALRASIISVLEPLVTVFVGILLLHETMTFVQLIGVIILLTSAIGIQFKKEL